MTYRPLLIVLLAMGSVACGRQVPPASLPAPPTATVSAAADTVAVGGFGATERAFVELTIAAADQAVRLLDLGAARATEPLLREFSSELAKTRRAESAALRELLSSATVPYRNPHEGHDMPGMPTDAELDTLSTSKTFDAEFTRLVRAHLAESMTMIRPAVASLTHQATRRVAAGMAAERQASLTRLDGLG